MRKPLVAVIDDELNSREKFYEKILSPYFEIRYVRHEDELNTLKSDTNIKLLVIDKVLHNWTNINSLEKVLTEYPELMERKTPIVAVSRRWVEDYGKALQDLRRLMSEYPIIHVVAWADVASMRGSETHLDLWTNTLGENIRFHFLNYLSLNHDIAEDESIGILQISDLHFGAETSYGAFMDHTMIAESLVNQGIKPHLVAVCGDVSHTGSSEEFVEADSWFEKLRSQTEPTIDLNRFVFTVGNHDCNFRYFAQNYYSFDFNKKEFVALSDERMRCLPNNIFTTKEELIFRDFLLFERKYIPRGNSIWRSRKLSTVNDGFSNWGIRVICLNTVAAVSTTDISGVGVDEKELGEIAGYCQTKGLDMDCTILITHHAPGDLGYQSRNRKDTWAKLKRLLQQMKVRIWLCGDQHQFWDNDIKIDENQSIKCISVGSLRLSQPLRAPEEKAGYNIIELLRKDGRVVDIRVTTQHT